MDKRADVWAFGVILFEMLTGARPFEGATVSDTPPDGGATAGNCSISGRTIG